MRREGPTFRQLTIADGLSQNAVTAIVQDRRGFLWFGTRDGLNRYDGHSFRVFRHDPFHPRSLSGNSITAVFEDRDGNMWVGTEEGALDRFDRHRETFHRYSLEARSAVNAIAQGPGGGLWIGTNGDGLARLLAGALMDPDASFQWFRNGLPEPSTPGDDFVNALLVDRRGVLWVGRSSGLDRLDLGADAFVSYPIDPEAPTGLMDHRGVTSLLEDREGHIWMGLASGLSVLNSDRSRITHHRHRYATERFGWGQVTAMLEDLEGVLWLATPSELMRFDPTTEGFEYLRHDRLVPDGVNSNLPTALLQDRSEVIWVGTNGYGLNVHDPKANRFRTFHRPEDQPWREAGFSVYTLFEDSTGTIWMGAGVLYRWDRSSGEFTSFETSTDRLNDFGNTGVWALVENPRGFLWAGTFQGLYHHEIATGRTRHYRHDPDDPDGLPEAAVNDVLVDPSGRVWVVTENWLAELVDPAAGRFQSFRYTDRAPSGRWTFPSLSQTPDGMLWFGSQTGLVRFDPQTRTFRHFRNDPTDPSSLGHDRVRAILVDPTDPQGTLWVGTVGGGLNRFDLATERFTHYTTRDGLPNNVVYGILPDDTGTLWLSTNRGLSRFDPSTGTFRNYDAGDGLQSDEFNSGAAFRSPKGELFFGGIYGVNYFHPDQIHENPHVPEVVITGFRRLNRPEAVGDSSTVLDRSILEIDEIRLSHADNVLTFEFAALDFSAPAKNRYTYRMLGFSQEWIDGGTERTATFTNLPPGSYTFQVRGSNNDGVWNEEGASLALVILPPWWWSRWAMGFYVLLALATGLVIRRYDQKRLRLEYGLAREREEAEQLRSLDRARSRFFANVSHEFRTPLTLTLGPLDDLHSGFHGDLPAPVAAQVELARRNAGRVLELIDQLLEVARLEAGNTPLRAHALDFGAFVHRIGARFEPLGERLGVELRVEVPHQPVEVFADPAHLDKILANLLSNALKFTSPGGGVAVRLAADETTARVTVTDTGPGIPSHELARIFDRFYRGEQPSEEATPGTGIGLALVRELVHLHGGSVDVESAPGAGSQFTVTLPLGRDHLRPDQVSDDPASYLRTVASPEAPAMLETAVTVAGLEIEHHVEAEPDADDVRTILLAEDNQELRGYLRSHLATRYRVLEADNGEEALALAQRRLPDLVISDVMMPVMDGYELCRRLKGDPDTDFIPVILLTARAAPEDRWEGLEGRADAYLTKPFDMDELRTLVRNHIEVRERLEIRLSGALVPGSTHAPGVPPTLARPHAAPVEADSKESRFLEEVCAVIEARMEHEEFTVEELAGRVAHSRGHLHRRLKDLIDESPSDLIRRMRLERAASLLEAQAGSVSRIAYAVGFKSVAHFSNRFSDHFGIRPSQYKGAGASSPGHHEGQ
ncbi:MAG: two-component regulator propeller domain-containing protein [Gemmatimonadota bacterium]